MNLNMTDPQPHTHYAHEGLLFAKEHDKGNEYAHKVFRAFYEDGINIGDISELRRIAEETGLPGEDFSQALEDRVYSDAREASIRKAYEEGVQAVPTFYIGDKKLTGLQSQEAYEKAVTEAETE
ncbi:DSBA-like thioredoxin domain-containing protein [Alkalicoccus daliensis]|uniref:DSBA-like thioredoxin domain-containing protein n=1 Tax=Alkalicoccus daliensis TaxID=745820 RepID=A0A1H0JCL3_9BACI|nr:DSBA-like thioredoxin domain-containing protein [Alkalicoccus daliensis]